MYNMCCVDKSGRKFARNVKKPSMFLSSLIMKRRNNRRGSKPNILLDAVLTNAINNIKSDKILSKLNNISKVKRFSSYILHSHSQKRTETFGCIKNQNGQKTISNQKLDDKKNEKFNYLLGVDNFFEELKNVKVENRENAVTVCVSPDDNEELSQSVSIALQNNSEVLIQDMVDNFIETGITIVT